MIKFLIVFCLLLASTFASAQDELKIEGSCMGQDRGIDISFTYYSAFDGCQNKSKAAVSFTSDQASSLKGTRVFGKGVDKYYFKENGQRKTAFWLVFADSTGNTQGIFKYRDTKGILRSVILQCEINDYEYSECGPFEDI